MAALDDIRLQHGPDAGKLPAYSWPGMYPLFYLDGDGSVLCPDCANAADCDPEELPKRKPVAAGANYEDDGLDCEECGELIPSAYGDPEAAATEKKIAAARRRLAELEAGR